MQRNIYFDLLTVLIILAAAGYYLIPWLWDKLKLNGNISVEDKNETFSLSPGNFALVGLMLTGLFLFLSFFTWVSGFSLMYFLSVARDSAHSMGIYSYLFSLAAAGFCLLVVGIVLIVFAPVLTRFLFKTPELKPSASGDLDHPISGTGVEI